MNNLLPEKNWREEEAKAELLKQIIEDLENSKLQTGKRKNKFIYHSHRNMILVWFGMVW